MFAVLYRWELKPGHEAQFIDGWERVTRAIHDSCGSFGSRLHQAADGTWMAYARWPDAETRERCEHTEETGSRLMGEAVSRRFDEITMEIVSDLLRE